MLYDLGEDGQRDLSRGLRSYVEPDRPADTLDLPCGDASLFQCSLPRTLRSTTAQKTDIADSGPQSRQQSRDVESFIVRDHRDSRSAVETQLLERLLRLRLDCRHVQLAGPIRERFPWLDDRQPNPELRREARECEREWRRSHHNQVMLSQQGLEKHLYPGRDADDGRGTFIIQRTPGDGDAGSVPRRVAEAPDGVARIREQHPPCKYRIGQPGSEHRLFAALQNVLEPPPDRIRRVMRLDEQLDLTTTRQADRRGI